MRSHPFSILLLFGLTIAALGATVYENARLRAANHLFADRATHLAIQYNALVRITMEMHLERDAALVHSHVVEVMAGMRSVKGQSSSATTSSPSTTH